MLGAKHAVAVTSGTAALFCALKACGTEPDDEVIVPDLAFIATANAVTLTGARPVLVDIDPNRLTIDPQAMRRALTPRTKAVIAVHVSGRAADLTEILSITQRHKLIVIEDAAEALGSAFQGKLLGTFGAAGCLSFTATKLVTSGQGGMVVTNSDAIAKKLRELKDQGRPVRGTGGDDIHHSVGYNFKFTDLQAAVLLGQLTQLSKRQQKMRSIYSWYIQGLAHVSAIRLLPFALEHGESPLWIDAVAKDRNGLIDFLSNNHINCRKFWHPIHTQRPYQQSLHVPHAEALARTAFWLPSSFQMTKSDVSYVCSMIAKYYATKAT